MAHTNINSEIETLTIDDTMSAKKMIVRDLESEIKMPVLVCHALLRYYNWDKNILLEKFVDGAIPAAAFGAYDPKNPSITDPEVKYKVMGECTICFLPEKPLHSLNCQHYFCEDCWNQHLTHKVSDEGTTRVQCPASRCDVHVDETTALRLIADKNVRSKYEQLALNEFINSCRPFNFCPGMGCDRMIIAFTSSTLRARCAGCKTLSCLGCLNNWHRPISCALLKMWLSHISSDKETPNWIYAHTKPCPKCKVPIERNEGCNHMTCRSTNCRYEFCWLCLRDWNAHKGESPWNCNKYSEEANNVAKKAETSEAALSKFHHHLSRFYNHERSLCFDQRLYENVDKMISPYMNAKYNYAAASFLKDAVETLCEGRRVLIHTYPFTFYLVPKLAQTDIFINNQQILETAIEELRNYLKTDFGSLTVNQLAEQRTNIQRTSESVRNVSKKLVEHYNEGMRNDTWKFTDPSISKKDF